LAPSPGADQRARRVDLAIGAVAGLSSGLLGVGGGLVIVPLQVIWRGTTQRMASGTSLAAIVPIALSGALVYYLGSSRPQLDLKVALFLMIGGSAGALAGARLATVVPDRALRMLVSVLMVAGAAKELHDALLGSSLGLPAGPAGLGAAQYALIVLAGGAIGFLSGLTGVGGGILVVPTLGLGFGLAQHVAQGTSLLAILPTAATGAILHHRHRDVDLAASGRMALSGVPASLAGSALALWLPARVLAAIFGALLLLMAWRMWPAGAGAEP
jgi:hypothetical protein